MVSAKNVIDINTLIRMIRLCDSLANAETLKAIFLTGFFGFFRLSNLTPHAVGDFDPTRHITGGDVFFTSGTVKLLLKWSKTIQMREQVKLITLPKLKMCEICPCRALKVIFRMYSPGGMEP